MALGISRLIGKVVIGNIIAKAKPMTMATHPELIGAYHAMCEKNGITSVPEILVSDSYHGTPLAMPKDNRILVGSIYFDFTFSTIQEKLAALTHETGHILADHPALVGSGSNYKTNEYHADRLAVQLLGDKAPVRAMVERMNELPRLPHETALREKLYGTGKERLANIEATNPQDRSELDKLIAAHAQRFAQQAGRRK